MSESESVINAAGKLTALGGSAQSADVAAAQAEAAGRHVDLRRLRQRAGDRIAELTGAEAACVTTGAAAGITIGIAAILCRENPDLLTRLPVLSSPRHVILQAGHAINFGATIEQMIQLSGATPRITGTRDGVTGDDLSSAIDVDVAAMLFVQSHHCVQENMVNLEDFIACARSQDLPVIVDAAAEEDLTWYIRAGADLVTYSGGKAFGGPTTGFITGRAELIELCEAQFTGIARTMKVGKEQIAGLLTALDRYANADQAAIRDLWRHRNQRLLSSLVDSRIYSAYLKPDEAGRDFDRVALIPGTDGNGRLSYEPQQLVSFLAGNTPSIRTRNHHISENIVLIDPRELSEEDLQQVIDRLLAFDPPSV